MMKRPLAILQESVDHFRSFSSLYLGYSAWILIPTLGVVLLDLVPNPDSVKWLSFFLVVVGTIAIVWVSIIMVHLATVLETDKEVDFEAIQIRSLKQIAPLLAVALWQLLAFLGGIIMLLLPFFFFVVWYTFAQVSVILDNKRGLEALVYSKSLVKGRYWYTAWGMIGVPTLIGLVFTATTGLFIVIFAQSTGQDVLTLFTAEREPVWVTAINTIGQLFLIPISTIYTTKFYLAFKETLPKPELVKPEQIG